MVKQICKTKNKFNVTVLDTIDKSSIVLTFNIAHLNETCAEATSLLVNDQVLYLK